MEQQTESTIFEICENENEQFTTNIVKPTLIETKWETIRIGSIKEVEITDKQFYSEEENNEVIKPSNFNSFVKPEKQSKIEKKGLLKCANLKISFTLSKKSPVVTPSLISYRKVDYTLPSNHRSKIEIIYNNQPNNQSEITSNQDKIYTIEVPFYNGLENLKVPFFDDFHTKGQNLIHHTIVLDAYDENNLTVRSNENGEVVSLRSVPEISYFIRLVIKDFKEVEIVSITTNNVDINRVADIFNNTKELTVNTAVTLKNSIFDLFGKCKRSKKTQKNSDNSPPPYSQIEYRLINNDNVNSNDDNCENGGNDRYAQFQKFATPVHLPVQLPPNCQIVYCFPPNSIPFPQNN